MPEPMILIIEWAGFIGVLVATWLYGYGGRSGPALGFISALTLILYGVVVEAVAIWLTNVAFAGIHARNWHRADG